MKLVSSHSDTHVLGNLLDPNGNKFTPPARKPQLTQGSILRALMAKKRREALAAKRMQ